MTAFLREGCDAYSCDILPCEGDYPERHIQGDVRELDLSSYDLIIAHPPCTYLSNAGLFRNKDNLERQEKTKEAIDFFMWFTKLKNKYVAIENPAGIISTVYEPPTQYVNPYQFGHKEMKKTGLWLFNLPKLHPTCNRKDEVEYATYPNGKKVNKWLLYDNAFNGHKRSKFFEGVAKAMAEQRTFYINNNLFSKLD